MFNLSKYSLDSSSSSEGVNNLNGDTLMNESTTAAANNENELRLQLLREVQRHGIKGVSSTHKFFQREKLRNIKALNKAIEEVKSN
jgi:hypothetical protein